MRLSDGYRGFQYLDKGKETISVHNFELTGRWVYGTHLSFGIQKDEKFAICGYALDPDARIVLPDSIGRCTGLIDCAGNLIFEDDILYTAVNNASFLVEWSDTSAAFLVRQVVKGKPIDIADDTLPMLCQIYVKDEAYRITGNRFQFALQDSETWNLSKDWTGAF